MLVIQLADLDGQNGFRLDGVEAGDRSGYALAPAGDVNGDGIDDLIVGVSRADGYLVASGVTYVIFGRAGGGFAASVDLGALTASEGFRIEGAQGADYSGDSVAGLGDVNGDGIDDLIVGARRADVNGFNSGASYVVFGRSDSDFGDVVSLRDLSATEGFRLDGPAETVQSGFSVAGAGDVNGDGIADIIVGAPYASPNGSLSGSSFVVFGRAGGGFGETVDLGLLTAAEGFRLDGLSAEDRSGYAVAAAGDVNGDGVADILVSAPRANPKGFEAGSAYVVFGRDGGGFGESVALSALNGTNGFRLDGVAVGDFAGRSVAGLGDVNGDGVDDIIVGAAFTDPVDDPNGLDAGSSYVVFGRPGGGFAPTLDLAALDGANGFRIDGAASRDRSGFSVSGAGDVNGDGIADILVSAFTASLNGAYSGSTYVVFGRAEGGFAPVLDLGALTAAEGFRLDGAAREDQSGRFVSGAGDLNGDGIDDLVVGAPFADPNGGESGSSYVVFGFRTIDDGANRISGSALAERFDGLGGNDTIFGLGGNDTLIGGAGNDRLEGGPGANVIDGGTGLDTAVFAGALSAYTLARSGGTVTISRAGESHSVTNVESFLFADGARSLAQLFPVVEPPVTPPTTPPVTPPPTPPVTPPTTPPAGPTPGDDNLRGTGGPDRIAALAGDDTVRGRGGDDTLLGQAGQDVLRGGGGDDSLVGGGGADRLFGQAADDTLKGGGAADFLKGGGGADRLIGGGGADTIEGGKGADTMIGGGGADTFRFAPGDGADVILRFQQGADQIEFKRGVSGFDELRIEQQGDDVLVTYNRGSILFQNQNAAAFGEDDFIF